jgi:hypothetical protein
VKERPDPNDTLRAKGADAVRERADRADRAEHNGNGQTAWTLQETLAVFDRWLLLNDTTPILAVLGAVAANYLPGDPVWLGIVGPPSSAKTEILNSTALLPKVVQVATLTPAALLSGTPVKQRDKGAHGGLMREIGDFGILVLKDFGSILSLRPDAKAEVLAALRELYDGSWTRRVGSGGGRELTWRGKLGLVFASTGVIDLHHTVISQMGDRYLLTRLAPVRDGQFARALQHAGTGNRAMRKELAEAVQHLFAGRRAEPRPISEQEIERLDKVLLLVVQLRAPVERDRVSREVEAIFGAEGTARVGLMIERLLAGLDVLGVERELALRTVEAVAMDSVPPLRRSAYEYAQRCRDLHDRPEWFKTSELAEAMELPTVTVRRVLEDLAAYGLVRRKAAEEKGKADSWAIAE